MSACVLAMDVCAPIALTSLMESSKAESSRHSRRQGDHRAVPAAMAPIQAHPVLPELRSHQAYLDLRRQAAQRSSRPAQPSARRTLNRIAVRELGLAQR